MSFSSSASSECNVLHIALVEMGESGSPYRFAIMTCAFVSLMTFFVSTLCKNYSQVDKLWSILPVLYVWMCVVDSRTFYMACLITVWGIRLTFNFYRRGGYTLLPWKGEEDYRWAYVRQGVYLEILTRPIVWHLFNFTFISFYQNILLLLIATPSFVVYSMATYCQDQYAPFRPWGTDGIIGLLLLFFILIESIADNQQFHFQSEKAKAGLVGPYAHGFCETGLFSILRKPHYAAEQSIWITFYFFGVAATRDSYITSWINYSVIGSILLCLLFQGSASLTESITANKYPKYSDYKKRVPLFLPRLKRISKIKQ